MDLNINIIQVHSSDKDEESFVKRVVAVITFVKLIWK